VELEQEIEIGGSLAAVWEALNDPEVLQRSLPGCEAFDAVGENAYEIRMVVKVGPVKAKFAGEIELSDIEPLVSYTISGSGKGGVAGFASGSAAVKLTEIDPETTRLSYAVSAKVGGKLAQLGARLVDGAAKKMAADFFSRFGDEINPPG